MSRRIVVFGGTGFVGRHFVSACLGAGDSVVVVTRGGGNVPGAELLRWDGETVQDEWSKALSGADAIVNFAGETVNQRWTSQARLRIVDSRVKAVKAICSAAQSSNEPPKRWINASAVGFYGDRGSEVVDEGSPKGSGYLADVCALWEQAVASCAEPRICKTCIRIGVVLGDGGALPTLTKLARLGLGGTVGTGRQAVSWIHIDDLVKMILWCLESDNPPTVLNGTAPAPVSNADFMRCLRAVTGARFGLPAPALAVEIVGKVLGPDSDLVLKGVFVRPKMALENGFKFGYPDLKAALTELLR